MEFFRLFTAVRPDREIMDRLVSTQESLRAKIHPDAVRWVKRDNLHLTLHFLGDTEADRLPDVIQAMDVSAGNAAPPTPGDRAASGATLALSSVGAFPNARRPRVLWAGLSDLNGTLAAAYRVLGRELASRGFELDSKPFRPHITLGYVRKRVSGAALRSITAAISEQREGVGRGRENAGAGDDVRTVTELGDGVGANPLHAGLWGITSHGAPRPRSICPGIGEYKSSVPKLSDIADEARFDVREIILVRSMLAPGGSIYENLYSVPLSSASDSTSAGDNARE